MNCEAFEEKISEYLDQGLAPLVRRQFAAHLLACRSCHRLFSEVRENIEMLSRSADRPDQPAPGADLLFLPPAVGGTDHDGATSRPGGEDFTPPTIGELVSCRLLDVIINDFFESRDDLAESDRPELRAVYDHLTQCAECNAIFSGLRRASDPIAPGVDLVEPENSHLEARILAVTCGARF